MVLSKAWFDDIISSWTRIRDNEIDSLKLARDNGILEGLKLAYFELVKAPIPGEKKKTGINIEKGFDSIVKYYMNDKKFMEQYPDEKLRMEKANEIAISKMDEQQKRIA